MPRALLLLPILITLQGACTPVSAQQPPPPYKNPALPVADRVADLLSRMTPEEKVAQLTTELGWRMYTKHGDQIEPSETFKKLLAQRQPGSLWALLRADPWTKVTLKSGLSPKQSAQAVNALQQYAIDHSRLGIPLLLAEECPHGHMAIGATVFPTAIGQASTFNPALIHQMAKAIAAETRATGANVGYGPILDLARDPRWSRVEETYGEDPTLIRDMGLAMVRGFQGDNLAAPASIVSTLKHLAAHGIPEGGHNAAPANIGPRELHSAILPPFKAAVRAGAGSVMSSYNEIDGIPCSSNHSLLTHTLRTQWGFQGFVVSDLYAIDALAGTQHVAPDASAAAALALHAGVDSDLGARMFSSPLLQAVANGQVSPETLDRSVARILRAKFLLGLFENPYADPAAAEKIIRSEEHRALARRVARESITLLKNADHLLPLAKDLPSIAVIGPNADSVYNQLGDYTAPQSDGAVTTVLEAVRQAVSPNTTIRYAKGCAIRDPSTKGFPEALDAARQSALSIVVLGGSSARDFNTLFEGTGAAKPSLDASGADMESGEGFDRASLDLAGPQLNLLKQIVAIGKPVVLVLIKGRPLILNWPADHVPAILDALYPGEQGGAAIADVLFGDYNPAGRLPISIPRSVGQLPVYYNHKPDARRDYLDQSAQPLYPFGHGLSYTQFTYANPRVTVQETEADLSVTITIDITNTGPRLGDEVVQLYLRPHASSVTTPAIALKAFQRIAIKPNQTESISFRLTAPDLALLNRDMRWLVEPGSFTAMLGASSADIRRSLTFTVRHAHPILD